MVAHLMGTLPDVAGGDAVGKEKELSVPTIHQDGGVHGPVPVGEGRVRDDHLRPAEGAAAVGASHNTDADASLVGGRLLTNVGTHQQGAAVGDFGKGNAQAIVALDQAGKGMGVDGCDHTDSRKRTTPDKGEKACNELHRQEGGKNSFSVLRCMQSYNKDNRFHSFALTEVYKVAVSPTVIHHKTNPTQVAAEIILLTLPSERCPFWPTASFVASIYFMII